jgi:diaminohydroxyphosphoribosylaminopyrimidine deaminase/5-amino-6-(5-phosphoribosylamino)uracil reductase
VSDAALMARALALAADGRGRTGDNPVVGCVIVDAAGAVVGEARTADGGRPHAEEEALAQAGAAARGGAAFVTLEPCAQRSAGGTACTDLLIRAGVARVVIAARDPHPFAAGAGVARLRAAGIAVEIGVGEAAAKALNADFLAKWGGGS